MVSIKLSLKWGVYQHFLLTMIFDHKGGFGQIESNRNPCKILTLDTEIKKLASGSF